MGLKFTEDRIESDRPVGDKDCNTAMSIITAMVAKNRPGDEMMAVLASALAIVTTVFSPTSEDAKANRQQLAELVISLGDDMWELRPKIEAELKRKVDSIMPFAMLHEAMIKAAKERPEPQFQQFKI